MKAKKITVALFLCLALSICAFTMLQLVNAKATKTTFVTTLAWAPGASPPNDFEAGQTLHRRNRITIFNITETDNSLFNGNMTRVVNFNRNNNKEITQRWGTFEIVLEGVLLWKGTWTGRAVEGTTTENYVGHGVGALDGIQIRFTLTSPGGLVTGFILNTHG
jgi:hypothetical protein